jgi:hypothetical protein
MNPLSGVGFIQPILTSMTVIRWWDSPALSAFPRPTRERSARHK